MRFTFNFSGYRRLAVCAFVSTCCLFGQKPAQGVITLTKSSSTDWKIANGALSLDYNPTKSNITSIRVTGQTSNILDPNNSQLYDELAKSGLGSGTVTANDTLTSNYVDFYTTTQSNSTNPFNYQIHYVLFNNDPAIHMYEVVNHSSTDIAGTYGQGQFLMRVNPSLFPTTYQQDLSAANLGGKTTTIPNYISQSSITGDAGRAVQDATIDLNGTSYTGDNGSTFYTKYDYSTVEQFHKGHTEYGSTFAISTVLPSSETIEGGPTKQDLSFTDNILMVEFNSGHYGSGYGYTPTQGVDTSKLYGPYVFRITTAGTETGSQLYNDAINTIPSYKSLYDSEPTLLSNGYVASTARGALQTTVTSTAGFSSNTVNNTLVLSDPNVNMQRSTKGYQYWTQLSSTGSGSIGAIVPGKYRATIYQLGQWGETRYDGVTINANQTTLPSNLKFVPENFGTAAPIWTIGTPDRSAHEFLNGHDSAGKEVRQFYGAYNYWQQEADLGNNGKVVYYATAVGNNRATNDPNKWISNQWGKFNPGLYAGVYNSADDTTDGYKYVAPSYVGDPSTYTGAAWEVHFNVTSAQLAQGKFAVLSVGLAGTEASLSLSLNGHPETWHSSGNSDSMVRSGQSGYYQMLAFQFPIADVIANADNLLTFSVSATSGVQYDALRFEITNTAADPTTTGWHDYEYITGTNTQTAANDTLGLAPTETFTPEPASASLLLLGLLPFCRRRTQRAG